MATGTDTATAACTRLSSHQTSKVLQDEDAGSCFGSMWQEEGRRVPLIIKLYNLKECQISREVLYNLRLQCNAEFDILLWSCRTAARSRHSETGTVGQSLCRCWAGAPHIIGALPMSVIQPSNR